MRLRYRMQKRFTLDLSVVDYMMWNKRKKSAGERVNHMLKRATLQERYDRLEQEAEAFFASAKNTEREETSLSQSASIRSIAKP